MYKNIFNLFWILTLFVVFQISNSAFAAGVPITSKGGATVGTLTTCSEVRTKSGSGWTEGVAGFKGNGAMCAGAHCSDMSKFDSQYTCAGASVGAAYDIVWPDFDLDPPTMSALKADLESKDPVVVNAAKKLLETSYSGTTRDTSRGRAGDDSPLFMNAHGICRMINKTETSSGFATKAAADALDPIFVGVDTEEEWRTVHGVPSAGDPNGGNVIFPNQPNVDLEVCCSPQMVTICGQPVGTGYAPAGKFVDVYASSGTARVQCVANNTWDVTSVMGVCGGSHGSSSRSPGGGGYSNPATGGEISKSDWGGMSSAAKSDLSSNGYSPDPSVDSTNAEGQAAKDAAEEAEKAKQEQEDNEDKDAADKAGSP